MLFLMNVENEIYDIGTKILWLHFCTKKAITRRITNKIEIQLKIPEALDVLYLLRLVPGI